MKDNKRIIFLTGATGLVGSYLLKILLQEGHKVYALARSKNNKNAKDRVTEVLNFWDKDVLSEKSYCLEVLEGDIAKKNLGLDKQNIDLLENEIEEIFHCAAGTLFNLPLQEIRKVNVEGTKNVLDLAIRCNEKGRLKKVNHLSTVYVCGDYKGDFREDNLDVGQGFNSTYEQSKFEAEKLVEGYRKRGLWIDIFRLSPVLGESTTGKTFKFEHFYQLLYLWSLEILEVFPINEKLLINFTYVDAIAKALYCLFNNSKIRNKNYHLFGDPTISTEEAFNLARKHIGFKKPSMISWKRFNIENFTPVQRNLINKLVIFSNTMLQAKFSSTFTRNILNKYNFRFPNFINKDLANIIQYAIDSKFIKKKSQ